ncbi:MAG: hypothetical protein IMF19_16770 [Proteobacteria bacterium]|nr:hypothetical protein [Pseudomonadota bacterium]
MSRSEVEIEYTPQDDGTVQIHKISGFPIRNPKESNESGFSIFEGSLYRKATNFRGSPSKILCKNRKYSKKYFDKVRDSLIKDICDKAPVEKKEIPISVPDTGILVEVKNASSGQNLYTVTAIKALTYEELPEIYTHPYEEYTLPVVWQHEDALIADVGNTLLLQVGKNYNYGRLRKALCYIELAGRHLAQAKAHHSEETLPGWAKYTFDSVVFKDGKFHKATKPPKPSPISEFWHQNKIDLGRTDISKEQGV